MWAWAAQATWEQELQQDWHFPICHVLIHGRVINWIMGSTSLPMNTANIIPSDEASCVSVPICETLLCIKRCLLCVIQAPKCNITALLPRAVQLVFNQQNRRRSLSPMDFRNSSAARAFSKQQQHGPQLPLQKRVFPELDAFPTYSPGLTHQLQTQSLCKPLWQNYCCCWITATHTRPQPESMGGHRGNTTAALQLRSLLGLPDMDMLTVWVVFLTSISATGSHSQLSCIYSLGFARCPLPNLPNFKELQVYRATPHINTMENIHALSSCTRRLVWGFWVRLACVD